MPLTIHHLRVSQSECIIWLCEELNIPYDLKSYNRSPLMGPSELKAIHPQGSAPVIQDGDLTLAESGACVEYIAHKYGQGKLFLKPDHKNYADFLYWFHWSNGSLMGTVMRPLFGKFARLELDNEVMKMSKERMEKCFQLLDERLKNNTWLAGEEFTAADIMMVFPLTTARYFVQFSLEEYPHLVKWLGRIGEREAYQRAMQKGDPELPLVLGVESPEKPLI